MTDTPNNAITRAEADRMAEQAAQVAVKKVFAILGVDINDPSEVEEFRKDLRFGSYLRKMADRGVTVAITVVVTAVMGGVLAAIKMKFFDGAAS